MIKFMPQPSIPEIKTSAPISETKTKDWVKFRKPNTHLNALPNHSNPIDSPKQEDWHIPIDGFSSTTH